MSGQLCFYVFAGTGLSLFFLQSVFWMALRTKKMKLGRWRPKARVIQWAGVVLFLVGALLYFTAGLEYRQAATAAFIAGGLNAFVATFHLRVVDYLVMKQRQQREK